MNDFSFKIDARKRKFLIQISAYLRKNEIDFQSRGKPKKGTFYKKHIIHKHERGYDIKIE